MVCVRVHDRFNDLVDCMRIGFIVPKRLPYNKVMASTRLRAYDVIRYLPQAEMYSPFRKYDVVIFQKAFEPGHIVKAEKLKNKGVKVGFDINVNYLCNDRQTSPQQEVDVFNMLKTVDFVIVSSEYLKEVYSPYNSNITVIEEMIEPPGVLGIHGSHKPVLVTCGYAVKLKELSTIASVLKKIYDKHKLLFLVISEKDPQLDLIPYKFIKYNQRTVFKYLALGDIFISPRDMSRAYNLGHSFTRVAYPMAVGLPVISSPIPSYSGSPVLFCSTVEQWRKALTTFIENHDLRYEFGLAGFDYVFTRVHPIQIIKKYRKFLRIRPKLCIGYKWHMGRKGGGANSAMRSLAKYFESVGVDITYNWDDEYDVILINSTYRAPGKYIDLKKLQSLKNRGVKILARVDGLRGTYGGGESPMDKLQLDIVRLADDVIYQSAYSKKVIEDALNEVF